MPNVETAVGLEDILKILGWSRAKFFRKKEELSQIGIIFKFRTRVLCSDGKYRNIREWRAFPSRVQRWMALKGIKREIV